MLPGDPGTVIPEQKVMTFCKAAKPWQEEEGLHCIWLWVASQGKMAAPAGPENIAFKLANPR